MPSGLHHIHLLRERDARCRIRDHDRDARLQAVALALAHVHDLHIVLPHHAVAAIEYGLLDVVDVWLGDWSDLAARGLLLLLGRPTRWDLAHDVHAHHARAFEQIHA